MTDAPKDGPRGRKDLACTAEATAFQKAFGAELRERVVERGEPFAVAQADTPHEIFHAMDIPVVSNQWWSAYISAKRLSGALLQGDGRPGLSGQPLQVLLAWTRVHAGQ